MASKPWWRPDKEQSAIQREFYGRWLRSVFLDGGHLVQSLFSWGALIVLAVEWFFPLWYAAVLAELSHPEVVAPAIQYAVYAFLLFRTILAPAWVYASEKLAMRRSNESAQSQGDRLLRAVQDELSAVRATLASGPNLVARVEHLVSKLSVAEPRNISVAHWAERNNMRARLTYFLEVEVENDAPAVATGEANNVVGTIRIGAKDDSVRAEVPVLWLVEPPIGDEHRLTKQASFGVGERHRFVLAARFLDAREAFYVTELALADKNIYNRMAEILSDGEYVAELRLRGRAVDVRYAIEFRSATDNPPLEVTRFERVAKDAGAS